MLSRFVIAYFPGNKHLLISWQSSQSAVVLEVKKIKSVTISTFSPSMWWDWVPWSYDFWMLSFKPAFSLSSLTVIKRLLSSSSLSAIRVVSSAYLRLLLFLLAILIPACDTSSWTCHIRCHMMYSPQKLNKQGDNKQPCHTPFPIVNQFFVSMSGSNCCFLTCIQVPQKAGETGWYSHLFKNFPQIVVFHTVQGFSQWSRCFSGILLLFFLWSSGCWQFDLWFLCLF